MIPYNWQIHNPSVNIPRHDVLAVVETLLESGGCVVLGGRGMGKSVFLNQVRHELERTPDLKVFLVDAPPPELTVRACLDSLAETLGVPMAGALDSKKIFGAYFSKVDAPQHLVLIFDELDRYAEKGDQPSAQPPGRGFFNDLEASRRSLGRLGILTAGSVGIYIFRDVLGSSYLARALHVRLRPFEPEESTALTRPFADRGSALPDEVLATLQLTTGGIPALMTYGLQKLWRLDRAAEPRDVNEIFTTFRETHGEYLRDLLAGLKNPRLSDAPQQVWDRIQGERGPIARSELEATARTPNGALDLDLPDVLHLLQASGLVRIEGSVYTSDPIVAHPIASLLNLPLASPAREGLREHFLRDLELLLGKLHRSGADFFRPHADGKKLVPESVFSAHLALGFELLGWTCEREAQSAAGRTDVKLRRNGSPQIAVVEVKIWGHPGYEEARRQAESYWTAEVAALAVVQVTDRELPNWPETYRGKCLTAEGVEVERRPLADSPIRAWLRSTASRNDGAGVTVDHFLLRLPRRA